MRRTAASKRDDLSSKCRRNRKLIPMSRAPSAAASAMTWNSPSRGERITQSARRRANWPSRGFGDRQRHPPAASIGGSESSFAAAISGRQKFCRNSRNPLIFGLLAAARRDNVPPSKLAERLRANIDTTASVCHGPSIMAIQQVGESTSSLGEVAIVPTWSSSGEPTRRKVIRDTSNATRSTPSANSFHAAATIERVVVDTKPTSTSERADVLQIKPERDFEMISILRQLVRGDEPSNACDTGVPLAIRDLADRE